MNLIDISPPLNEQTPVWPGDVKLTRNISLSIENGDNIDLSSLQSTVHIGAHADAPSHYGKSEKSIDQVDLSKYLGPCAVIEVMEVDLVEPDHLSSLNPSIKRVLFKTSSFNHEQVFSEKFTAIAPATIAKLADLGCVLVGIDTPSVDPFSSQTLDCHQMLLKHGMANLEGLDLTHADPAAHYELIALPLKLVGFDASPVRAILRTLA